MKNDPIEVTLMVTVVLEELGIPYLIGGSFASTLYGMVRTTQDSDIITEMQSRHIRPFVSALENDFYIDDEMISTAIDRHSSFNIIHRESMFKVDVFIPHETAFQKSQFERVRRIAFDDDGNQIANFASPEDTILSKLEWYRMGGEVSERQWRDILGVLKTKVGDLDLDYLRKWARELKVFDLLERAVKESE